MEKLSYDVLFLNHVIIRWKQAWLIPIFRWSLLIAISILLLVGFYLHDFFAYIEARPGKVLQDPFLSWLPSHDLSIPILLCIYIPLATVLIQAIKYPEVFWKFVVGFAVIHLLRIICLFLLPLETPENFIPPYDPLASIFYGQEIISKDLFFSGHTALVFWIFFSLKQGLTKKIILVGNFLLMIMLLIQHVHYTIDLLAALKVTIILNYIFIRINNPLVR